MKIAMSRLDHLVLTVTDIGATVAFYTKVLGMKHEQNQMGRHSLHFGGAKINLHQQGSEFAPHARHPLPGSADLCFLTDTPIEKMGAHLEQCLVEIIAGPVRRHGAAGELVSMYFHDPDGNLLEVANITDAGAGNPTHP